MGDVTYSVKLDEELKKKLAQFVKDSGVTGKEFFAQLLEMYELEKLGERNRYIVELKELDDHLKRIRSLYKGMLDELRTRIEGVRTDFQHQLEKEREKNIEISQKNEELKKKLNEISSELKKTKQEYSSLQQELKQFKSHAETREALVREYKQKIKNLELELENTETLTQENEKMKEALKDMKEYVESLEKEKSMLKMKLESVQLTLDEIRKRHSVELETLKSKGEYEKESALAQEKQRCQEKIEKIMNAHAKREDELSRTIRTLYSQLDKLRETILKEKRQEKRKGS